MLSGAFQATGRRSSKKKLQIILLGRKSVYHPVSKNSVCLLAAFVSYKNTEQKLREGPCTSRFTATLFTISKRWKYPWMCG